MCSPLIGMGLSIVGGLVNGMQQSAYVNAVNRANDQAYEISRNARQAEVTRQKAFENQSMAAWQNNLANLGAARQVANQDTAANDFMAAYDTDPRAATANPDGIYLSGQQLANPEIQQAVAGETAKAAAAARKRVQALAKLTSYGQVETGNKQSISDTSNELATVGGLRKGSLSVSQQEQSIQPARVTPASFSLGDILGGFGSMASRSGGYFA